MCLRNGECFISEQISSITNQVGVDPDIFISDDKSTDSTLSIVEDLGVRSENINIVSYGSAAKKLF